MHGPAGRPLSLYFEHDDSNLPLRLPGLPPPLHHHLPLLPLPPLSAGHDPHKPLPLPRPQQHCLDPLVQPGYVYVLTVSPSVCPVLFQPWVWSENSVWCRALHSLTTALMVSTYFWMLCEGTYLRQENLSLKHIKLQLHLWCNNAVTSTNCSFDIYKLIHIEFIL